MKNWNMQKLAALLAAAALSLALLAGCGSASSAPASSPAPASSVSSSEAGDQAEVKHITLTVTYADGHSDELAIDTTAEFLKQAIETEVELGGEDGQYGFYIESVNGEVADYDADGAYWAIYVNDEYGMYGIDSQPVADGDRYALVYTDG